jgi:hypothetical protein
MGKSIGFKEIMFFSCFIFLLINESYGQKTLPVYDGINYTVGTLVYDNTNWWCLNTTPTNDVSISAGSLSYSGLLESTANKISFSGAGDDFVIWFGDQPADTKIYYSFIFQVTDMTGISSDTPAHFAGFSNAPNTSSAWGCSIIIQKDASDPTKFNIAHGTRSGFFLWHTVDGTPTGTPVKYSTNTPIFIVACYEIIGIYVDGTPNDKSSMWINPSSLTFENSLPPTATINRDLTGSGINDIDVVNRFYIRQDAASNTPSIDIDEIRIGSTWASVTPKSIVTNVKDIFSERAGATIYPNPVKDIMKVDVKNADISSIEIFNLTGRRIMTKEVNQGTTNVDLSSLPNGMYLVSFKGAGVACIRKFIKK